MKIAFFGSILACSFAFEASAHHDLSGPVLMTYQGIDPQTRRPCQLFVTGVEEGPGGVKALRVQSDFGHGSEHPPEMILRPSSLRADAWTGGSQDGRDEMALLVQTPGNPRTAHTYNLRWWHQSHYDTFRCVGLQLSQ